MSIGIIVVVSLLAAVLIVVAVARYRLRQMSRAVFGVDSFTQGLALQQQRLAVIPKSVSGMTKIYLPQVQRDFPEFNYQQTVRDTQQVLQKMLLALSTGEGLEELPSQLASQARQHLEDLRQQGRDETFQDVQVHQTEIARYRKHQGTCVITFQSAVGHLHWITQGDQLVSGSRDQPRQTKYELELCYVQDPEKAGDANAVGTTCPNCGAPVTQLGSHKCEYCGGVVEPVNIRCWQYQHFREVV